MIQIRFFAAHVAVTAEQKTDIRFISSSQTENEDFLYPNDGVNITFHLYISRLLPETWKCWQTNNIPCDWSEWINKGKMKFLKRYWKYLVLKRIKKYDEWWFSDLLTPFYSDFINNFLFEKKLHANFGFLFLKIIFDFWVE